MPKIVFVQPNGNEIEIEAPAQQSIMQAGVSNGVNEIVAECGGAAMCATCHVHIEPPFLDALPPMSAAENELLEATASPRLANSRLSCQIKMTDALDGIIVNLPETQV